MRFMISVMSYKSFNMQALRLIAYNRALHPELFDLKGRRTDRHGDYEVELWLTARGHMVRFSFMGETFTETVVERGDHLPETGLIHVVPCFGEKDYEMDPQGSKIGYVTSIQTEALTDNLYSATLEEMRDFARETGALSHEWHEEGAPAPSLDILDAHKYRREFHIHSYHLYGNHSAVLRTQSIFECRYGE